MLVRVIVGNRLTNYTAGGVVRTTLKKRPPATKAAIVSAVQSILGGLTSETAAEYGVGAAELKAWQPGWLPNKEIAHALE